MSNVVTLPRKNNALCELYKRNERYRVLKQNISSLVILKEYVVAEEAKIAIDLAIDAVVRDYIEMCKKERIPPIVPV